MQIFDMFTPSCCQRHLHLFLKFNSSTMKTRLLGTLFLNTNLMARVPPPHPATHTHHNPSKLPYPNAQSIPQKVSARGLWRCLFLILRYKSYIKTK